ncbi:MAG: tetratricopeptide repeat protein [Anaeromyxobacter sp.]
MNWRRALVAAALLAAAALSPRSAAADALADVERGVPTVQSLLQLVQQGVATRAEAPSARAARKLSEAETYYLLGDWDRATALLREALEDPPFAASGGGDTARFYMGDALRRAGDCPAARPYLATYLALGTSQHQGEALAAAVDCAARVGDTAAVQSLLGDAQRVFGENLPGELRYLTAKATYARTDLPPAERLAQASAAFAAVPPPYEAQAAYFLGAVEVERSDLGAAVTQLQRCVGLQAADARAREVQDLCLMALGRVHAERDELPAALDAYGRIGVDSPQFEASLYETAWAYLDQGQPEAALRTARTVADLAPDARLAPKAALLEAHVLVQLGRFEEASEAYQRVVTEYGGARDALGSVLDLHEDPVRYLGELVSRHEGPLEVATPVPPVAMRWAAERPDVTRAAALAGDVEGGRDALEEAAALADRVDAALARNHGLDAFPDLRESYASAQAVENAAAVLQGEAATVVVEALRPHADPGAREQLDQVHAQRVALEGKLDALPRTADAAVARLDLLRSRLEAVDREAFRLAYGADASDAMITASQVWLETHKDEVRTDAASRQAFEDELRQHRQVVAGYRAELAGLQKKIALARDAAAGTDALQEEGRLRADYLALLARERELLAGARLKADPAAAARADRADALSQQLDGYAVQARAVGAAAADEAAQRAGAMQAQVARERLILSQQTGALEGMRGEVSGAVGLVAFRAFGDVRRELYGVALEGDVGLTDVAWARKKERVEKLRTLSAEKAEALRALEARYAPVLGRDE